MKNWRFLLLLALVPLLTLMSSCSSDDGTTPEEDDTTAPIVTQVDRLHTFWRAEDGHQEFFAQNPGQPYCVFVIAPKVGKLRDQFAHRLKS